MHRHTPRHQLVYSGKTYSGYSDADGQAIHTKDDFGRDTFVFFAASLHGTFTEVKNSDITE
ncbi:hypothetical protein B6I55_20505 [Klebsiella pneumoniae]|nr:hypothetical protein B6I55_20505 [Klebsiella pneumoniae]